MYLDSDPTVIYTISSKLFGILNLSTIFDPVLGFIAQHNSLRKISVFHLQKNTIS